MSSILQDPCVPVDQDAEKFSADLHWALGTGAAPTPSTYPQKEICSLAEIGESDALAAVKRTAHYFAIGLANMVTLYV
jgi:predicted NBD/HSP70 family sugar kinase